jgi:hypothetical protein
MLAGPHEAFAVIQARQFVREQANQSSGSPECGLSACERSLIAFRLLSIAMGRSSGREIERLLAGRRMATTGRA